MRQIAAPKSIGPGLTQKHPTRSHDLEWIQPEVEVGHAIMGFIFERKMPSFGPLKMRALTSPGELPDCPFVGNGWPIYSRRLVDALRESALTFPVTVQFQGRPTDQEGYLLCTPADLFDGLDFSLSLLQPNRFNPKAPDRVRQAVLRKDVIWPAFFRLARFANQPLVNEATQQRIGDLGLRGVDFSEPILELES